jgi:hypothetical protein
MQNLRRNGSEKMNLCGKDHEGLRCGGRHNRLESPLFKRCSAPVQGLIIREWLKTLT